MGELIARVVKSQAMGTSLALVWAIPAALAHEGHVHSDGPVVIQTGQTSFVQQVGGLDIGLVALAVLVVAVLGVLIRVLTWAGK